MSFARVCRSNELKSETWKYRALRAKSVAEILANETRDEESCESKSKKKKENGGKFRFPGVKSEGDARERCNFAKS